MTHRTWMPALLTGVALVLTACGGPAATLPPQPLPTIVEPTVRPVEGDPAALPSAPTLAAPAAQARPESPVAPVSVPGQIVLHQPFAIVIAYSVPQTGTGSTLFTPLEQAAQKAIEDHGPVHGYGVNLVSFNDNCTVAGGAAVARQIAADDRLVAVLGPACSKAAHGALPILENANVVLISGAATVPGLSSYGPGVLHRTLLDDDAVTLEAGQMSQIYITRFPAVQNWSNDFAAWGGQLLEEVLNHFAPHQYDAAGILLQALDQAASLQPDGSLVIDREALRAAVRGTSAYPGISGPITFESDGDRAL